MQDEPKKSEKVIFKVEVDGKVEDFPKEMEIQNKDSKIRISYDEDQGSDKDLSAAKVINDKSNSSAFAGLHRSKTEKSLKSFHANVKTSLSEISAQASLGKGTLKQEEAKLESQENILDDRAINEEKFSANVGLENENKSFENTVDNLKEKQESDEKNRGLFISSDESEGINEVEMQELFTQDEDDELEDTELLANEFGFDLSLAETGELERESAFLEDDIAEAEEIVFIEDAEEVLEPDEIEDADFWDIDDAIPLSEEDLPNYSALSVEDPQNDRDENYQEICYENESELELLLLPPEVNSALETEDSKLLEDEHFDFSLDDEILEEEINEPQEPQKEELKKDLSSYLEDGEFLINEYIWQDNSGIAPKIKEEDFLLENTSKEEVKELEVPVTKTELDEEELSKQEIELEAEIDELIEELAEPEIELKEELSEKEEELAEPEIEIKEELSEEELAEPEIEIKEELSEEELAEPEIEIKEELSEKEEELAEPEIEIKEELSEKEEELAEPEIEIKEELSEKEEELAEPEIELKEELSEKEEELSEPEIELKEELSEKEEELSEPEIELKEELSEEEDAFVMEEEFDKPKEGVEFIQELENENSKLANQEAFSEGAQEIEQEEVLEEEKELLEQESSNKEEDILTPAVAQGPPVFLQDSGNIVGSSKPKVYSLPDEFAKNKKNKNLAFYFFVFFFIIVLGGGTYLITKEIQKKTKQSVINIKDFEDINLADLVNTAKDAQRKLDNLRNELKDSRLALQNSIQNVNQNLEKDITKIKASKLSANAQRRRIRALREAAQRRIIEIREKYQKQISQKESQLEDAKKQAGIYEQKLKAKMKDYEKKYNRKIKDYEKQLKEQSLEAGQRVYELKLKQLKDKYERKIKNMEGQIKNMADNQLLAIRNLNKVVSRLKRSNEIAINQLKEEITSYKSKVADYKNMISKYRYAFSYYSAQKGEHGFIIDARNPKNIYVELNRLYQVSDKDTALILDEENKKVADIEFIKKGNQIFASIIKKNQGVVIKPFYKILLNLK